MEYSEWKAWYKEIAEALHLSEAEDQAATDRLSQLLNHPSTKEDLERLVRGRGAVVFGAGPSLEVDIKRAKREGVFSRVLTICADGATSAFLRYVGKSPDIIVSDLDGDMEDIVYANRKGGMVLVHAHGDNIPALNRYSPLFERPFIGTTQVQARPNVYNFGGFTDGDRAAFAAEAYGASPMILAGMDLGSLVGRYSKPGLSYAIHASEKKMVKLGFARRLLEWLAENGSADFVNCTRGGEDLRGIPRADWADLRRIVN